MTNVTGDGFDTDNPVRGTRAEVRREKIVAAARALFADHGFHGTSMSKLSARSGVLVGQIYRDFANKEAIVAAIVDRDLRDFHSDDKLREACINCDRSAVKTWIERFVAGHRAGDPLLIIEIIAESRRNPKVEAILLEVDAHFNAQIVRALTLIFPSPDATNDLKALSDIIRTLAAGVFQRTMSVSTALDPAALEALTAFVGRAIVALEDKYCN